MHSLLRYPDPRLAEKSRPVERFDDDLTRLVVTLNRQLKHHDASGFAAPQIGVPLRVVLLAQDDGPALVLVNPVVRETEGEAVGREGCLSVPGAYADIARPRRVRIEAADMAGRLRVVEREGEAARAAMHEIDHLDGILFWDRLPGDRRRGLIESYRERNDG